MGHELKVLLAEVDGEAATALLPHVGDAGHVEDILSELVLSYKGQSEP